MTQHDDEREALEAFREWFAQKPEGGRTPGVKRAFIAGWNARTPTITEEMIERTAEAIYDCGGGAQQPGRFVEETPNMRNLYLRRARAALTAALDPNQQENPND